jgi:hypothetical protein
MRRSLILLLPIAAVAAFCGAIAGCGGSTTNGDGSGGAAGGPAGGGAGGSGDAACAPSDPPTPVSEAPPGVGCYVGVAGVWIETPCSCQLWLRNTLPSGVKVAVSLLFKPVDIVPSLTGSPDVEVMFEDADATWYATLARQPGNGSQFSVAHVGNTTTVRLGASSLTLSTVSLPACARNMPIASVNRPWGTRLTLEMQGVLIDSVGNVVVTNTGECFQPAVHSVFGANEGPEAGPPDAGGAPL